MTEITEGNAAAPSEIDANVKDYGAKGDGTTDDTTAIANALAAIGSSDFLYFPPGNYLVSPVSSTSLFTLAANVKIRGAGSALTKITCKSTPLSPQGQSLFYTAAADVEISGLTIDGGTLSTIQSLIRSGSGCTRLTLNDLIIKNAAPNQGVIYLADSTFCRITNIYVEAFVGTLDSQTAKAHGLCLIDATKGTYKNHHKISNFTVLGGYFGLYLKNQQRVVATNLHITGPVSSTADSGDGINFDNSDYCAIGNASITGRQDAGFVVYSDVGGQGPNYNVFSNITSNWNTLDGFYVASGRFNNFSNIVAVNNNKGNPTYGNRYGIYVNVDSGGTTQYNMFNGILATDTQGTKTHKYGIAVASGATDTFFLN